MTGLRPLPRWLGLAFAVALAAAPLAGKEAPPARPTRLAVKILTPVEVKLTWKEHGGNAAEVRVELRTIDGAFEDVGAIPAGSPEALVQGLQPATAYVFRVRAGRGGTFSDYSNEVAITTTAVPGACLADAQTLCLGGRFRARAAWKSADGRSGLAIVQPVPTGDSGLLWFLAPDNLELLVKVLDGCAGNAHHWVFVGPATNFQYLLTVTDTQTGEARVYFNPQGVSPQAVTDTTAFEGCP